MPAGGGSITQFDPVVTWIDKDANLGVEYGANDAYRGGGYLATFYPEGVISATEYDDNLASMQKGSKEYDEYKSKYAQVGNLYYDEKENLDAEGKVSEEFAAKFNYAKERLVERYERMHIEDLRIDIADDYILRVFVPQASSSLTAYTATFSLFSNMGDLEVLYGTSDDVAAATTVLPAAGKSIGDYVKSATTMTDGAGTHYVVVNFTSAGKDRLASRTADAATNGGYLFFKVGEGTVISLPISSPIENAQLPISSTSFTTEYVKALAILIDSTANAKVAASDVYEGSFSLHVDSVVTMRALYGDSALIYMYIAFGVLFVLMMVFFFVRYGLLGFVHLYTYMFFLLVTLLCMWSVPFVTVSTGTYAAVLLASLLLSASQVFVYERARKEYASGKTMTAAVKNAYKSTFWHVFDLHVVVAGVSFITYAISLGGLSGFAFVLGLASLFSGICALALGRFMWAIMMRFTNKQGKFCHFKRKEVEEDED